MENAATGNSTAGGSHISSAATSLAGSYNTESEEVTFDHDGEESKATDAGSASGNGESGVTDATGSAAAPASPGSRNNSTSGFELVDDGIEDEIAADPELDDLEAEIAKELEGEF